LEAKPEKKKKRGTESSSAAQQCLVQRKPFKIYIWQKNNKILKAFKEVKLVEGGELAPLPLKNKAKASLGNPLQSAADCKGFFYFISF